MLFLSAKPQEEKDYFVYHKQLWEAEDYIFLQNNPKKGLELFKRTFSFFDFVFVHDCIEAFQIALVFNEEDYALYFIKRALDNGFELDLLSHLTVTHPVTTSFDKVSIYKPFMEKHRTTLEQYSDRVYPQYLKRIDKKLLNEVLKRHVLEQLHKDYNVMIRLIEKGVWGIASTKKQIYTDYVKINASNMRFIDSLGKEGIYLGEHNLGRYTNKLMASLDLDIKSIEAFRKKQLEFYKISENLKVPMTSEGNYFGGGQPYFTMIFHNENGYETMYPYHKEAIQKGYLHPREYASHKIYGEKPHRRNGLMETSTGKAPIRGVTMLALQPYYKGIPPEVREQVDRERKLNMVKPYALDSAKRAFSEKHTVQLFFGFMYATS